MIYRSFGVDRLTSVLDYWLPIRPILSPLITCLPVSPNCICPFVVRFLPIKEGDFVLPLSISPVREGSNTTLQVIK